MHENNVIQMATSKKLGASFRDPSGFVFRSGPRILRQINEPYRDNYRMLMESGLHGFLVDRRLIVSHREVDGIPFPGPGGFKMIEPELVRYISYPYEWCFSQLKDAALLTLEIQKAALKHDMSLKDASAYNIQFVGSRPVFIDTLSFEKFNNGPWVAYKQFCQHFLAPLALASKTDQRLTQLSKVFMDGIPLDLTARLLPVSTKLRLGLLMHIHMHAKSQKKYADEGRDQDSGSKIAAIRFTTFKAIALIDQLISTVSKLEWKLADTEWGNYYSDTNYKDDSMRQKALIIKEFFTRLPDDIETIQDLGANDGKFGREIAEFGTQVVCHDIDETAVEKNYLAAKSAGDEKILPLVQNLVSPSPAIGWANSERESLAQRGPLDLSMALALIHHIAISNNVPLGQIAGYFASLSRYLIVEFVPKTDSQVRRLLATREDIFPDYSVDGFEKEFRRFFEIRAKKSISGSHRILYLMESLAP